jgi:hypothetical protein
MGEPRKEDRGSTCRDEPRELPELDEDKPVNGTAHHHVYADSVPPGACIFTHKGKSVALDQREHALATKLFKARGKGFLDYNVLSRTAGVKDIDILHVVMTTLTAKMEKVDLYIGVKKKLGYWMKEAEADA